MVYGITTTMWRRQRGQPFYSLMPVSPPFSLEEGFARILPRFVLAFAYTQSCTYAHRYSCCPGEA